MGSFLESVTEAINHSGLPRHAGEATGDATKNTANTENTADTANSPG